MTITFKAISAMKNNEGFTLKDFDSIEYRTGYQVAIEGKETRNARTAMRFVREYNGNCGVWFSEGIYYIDKSHRVNTKKEAVKIGIECNQISVYSWKNKNKKLIFC